MVADIRLLQGKIVEDPEMRTKNISKLIEELAIEILTEEQPESNPAESTS